MSMDLGGGPNQSILRLSDAGAQSLLEQFRGSPLIAQGKVNIIGLGAIAQRLGSRWAARSDLVHEHAQRVLRATLNSEALVQRVSDTEYVIVQAQASATDAQLRCLNALREILTYFLGAAPIAELSVCKVTRITDGGIYGSQLSMHDIERLESAERHGPHEEPGPQASLDHWTPFTSGNGLRLAVSTSLEPVIALKTGETIGQRVTARVQHQERLAALSRQELEQLSSSDTARIDLGAIARGLDGLRASRSERKPAALILPVSYSTLQSRRGRAPLMSLLRQARGFVEIGLICEITRSEGAPIAGLQAALAALKPVTLHRIVHLADIQRDDVRHLVALKLDGVSGRCPAFESESAYTECVRSYAKANAKGSRGLFLYQVPDMHHGLLARRHGVTHVSLPTPPINPSDERS